MKKILTSVFAIAAVATVAGIGSWALWSDEDTSNNNVITAGSMDLQYSVDGEEYTSELANAIVTVENAYPGKKEGDDIWVRNKGVVPGRFTISLDNIVDYENGIAEPERDAGDTTASGELSGQLQVRFTFDVDGSPIVSSWKTVTNGVTWNFGNNAILDSDEAVKVYAEYRVNSGADNTIMTDKVRFSIKPKLDQVVTPQ